MIIVLYSTAKFQPGKCEKKWGDISKFSMAKDPICLAKIESKVPHLCSQVDPSKFNPPPFKSLKLLEVVL
jgi:hypothetical protein